MHRTTDGLGLGLSAVHSIVERHKSTVHALSEGKGSGAQFVVELPSAAARRRASARLFEMLRRVAAEIHTRRSGG